MRILDDTDREEELEEEMEKLTRELAEKKLKEARKRLAKYGGQKLMEESG